VVDDPGQGAFDDPASGKHGESGQVGSFDDLDDQAEGSPGVLEEGAGVAAVGPDQEQPVACCGAQTSQ
jgi:hypothetical protein